MLKTEDNVLLTRTGPGTTMGDMFRYYWIPVLKSNEIPEPDGPTKKVKILSEDLVAFRDSKGQVGLVDERCPHRGTSLALAINAGCGLTCIYHGWKFNTNGECVDLPSEPNDSDFRKGMKLKSYPVVERNGIIWSYLGPKEHQPPFPEFYWMGLPEERVISERVWQECNYLQVMENDLDFVHAAFLHKALSSQNVSEGILSSDLGIDPNHPLVKNPPVKQHIESTNYGKRCIAVGIEDENLYAFMEIHYIFPFYTYPPRFDGEDGMWHAFIPRDDYSTWSWDVQFSHHTPMSNNYEQDRELMKDGNFSGIRGIANQDHAATESMGPIVDRSKESLGTSDAPIIQMRRMLLEQVKRFADGSSSLPKLQDYPLQKLYSAGKYGPKEKEWQDIIPLDECYKPFIKV
jgi:phthalate 4,5-dioxygenase oxygenase subunit